ncbi:DNA glycosylase/AP lyase ROS1 isoform X1 [Cryptomeria japonica]|uniref:DNA glycosylase/AP lyase ROS1 isoform X1 n=1 Tax=Cryptomeria japonica TaxID=3369 RepID=UPI0027DA9BC9|nr:DNA glycosylase/AP lyase ROS1 isoform X1 [Cryptomeria japonica]
MLMENNQRERNMADILKGGSFSSPAMDNKRERSMTDILKEDLSTPGVPPNESQISPATPLRPIARKRKLVFDDEPLLPPRQTHAASKQSLGFRAETGPSDKSSNGVHSIRSPLKPHSAEEPVAVNMNTTLENVPHQQPYYMCASGKDSDTDGILGFKTAKESDALFRNAQRLLNAVNRSVCGIPNANVSIPNANLMNANYHQPINPSGNICLNGWSRPSYPYFSPFARYPSGILAPHYLHSTTILPHHQTFTSLPNNGFSLAPETPEKNIHIERLRKRHFVDRHSDESVVIQENQKDTPEKSIQDEEKLLKTQSSHFVSYGSDEMVDVQERQQEIISMSTYADVEASAGCGDESILPSLIDPLSFTLQTPTKNNEHQLAAGGEGNGGIDLNKTPTQKPKRKKHRPKVIREGPSAPKSKARKNDKPDTKTNVPDYESNPPGHKSANDDKETVQKLQTDASVHELTNGITPECQETCSLPEEIAQHVPEVILQDKSLVSSLRTQEEPENSKQRGSFQSPIKRAFRENFKTLARKKDQLPQLYPGEPQSNQFNKQKVKKRLSKKHNAENETDMTSIGQHLSNSGCATIVHSIHGRQSGITQPYTRADLLDPVDMIIARLKQLRLNETEVGNGELVPYSGNGDMVPYEGPFDPLKKRKHRPKVDLDAETNRVWKLLMGKASEEDKQASNDEEKQRKLEEERQVFRGRVDSFIARMRLVQGDRRFSQWKGSVVDSVVGAFLTQNVSDHLSSSAFIAMASRFPPTEENRGTIYDSNALGEIEIEKEKVTEDISYTIQFPDQTFAEQNPGHYSFNNEIDRLHEENLKENANCGESFASNHLGDKRSSPQVINSVNCSESNSDTGEQTNRSDWIHTFNDTHSFTELLREVENRTHWGLTKLEKQQNVVAVIKDPSSDLPSIHENHNRKPPRTPINSSEILDHTETGSEVAQDHIIDCLERNTQKKDHQYNVSSTRGSSLTEDSMNAAATLCSLAQEGNSTLHSRCLNPSEGQPMQASELVQSSSPPDSHLLTSELVQSSSPPDSHLLTSEMVQSFSPPDSHLLTSEVVQSSNSPDSHLLASELVQSSSPPDSRLLASELLQSSSTPESRLVASELVQSSSPQGSRLVASELIQSSSPQESRLVTSELLQSSSPQESHLVASELIQSSSPPDSHLLPRVGTELVQSSTPPQEIEAIEDFGLEIPKCCLNDGKPAAIKVPARRISGIARANIEMNHINNKQTFNWEAVRKKAPEFFNNYSAVKKKRDPSTVDAMNWEAVRCADVENIADTIKERGMNNILAGRIKAFLERLHAELGCIDLEWLRDIPPDDAKDFLLSIRGLGLKSVECIRLLTLQHLAFPVDTNVGRICVRLGWVPIMPLPESLQLHLLELYPVQANIQKYIWPRLCTLDQRTLYELHYQMITFGKVFCTKSKPNCNACPMRAECKHFASAFASARLTLQGPQEKSSSGENPLCTPPILSLPQHELKIEIPSKVVPLQLTEPRLKEQNCETEIPSKVVPLQLAESGNQEQNCEPIVEEPATPEPEHIESSEVIDEWAYTDPDEIPVIKLNLDELSYNIQQICKSNMQDVDVSKALIMLSPQDASIPAPKLKYVHRLRTEHRVYEIPDNHPLLSGYEHRQPDDPSPYLLAIWTPGEASESTGDDEHCSSITSENPLSNQECCTTCVSKTDINEHTIKGTMLIPCRTAMRGNFPLNGTYFQHNEVFADHETSLSPVEVPRSWIWNLERRTVLVGTSIPTIFKGLTTREIQYCFWQGFVCVRAFDRNIRAPRPLVPRLHSPASKLVKTPTRQPRKNL